MWTSTKQDSNYMNHINQRNKLDIQISSYVAFLKIATRSQSIKLCKEITRLQARVELIDLLPYKKQLDTLDESFETKQSKMNLKTITNHKKEYLTMSKKKRNAPELCKPIFDEAPDSRRRAIELVSQHKDTKPIKYDLKK